jgi:hypothetical protein
MCESIKNFACFSISVCDCLRNRSAKSLAAWSRVETSSSVQALSGLVMNTDSSFDILMVPTFENFFPFISLFDCDDYRQFFELDFNAHFSQSPNTL